MFVISVTKLSDTHHLHKRTNFQRPSTNPKLVQNDYQPSKHVNIPKNVLTSLSLRYFHLYVNNIFQLFSKYADFPPKNVFQTIEDSNMVARMAHGYVILMYVFKVGNLPSSTSVTLRVLVTLT